MWFVFIKTGNYFKNQQIENKQKTSGIIPLALLLT